MTVVQEAPQGVEPITATSVTSPSEIAIRVDNIGKLYRLGERESYKALRDTLTDVVAAPFRGLKRLAGGGRIARQEELPTIWALRNVSMDIGRGEVVGVIGHNGAGKSTFLKILSRITEPTEGRLEIHGRVGSLLEVGTGFHPELSGRENIFLNGAILGMKRAEIERKFDEIVAFAEVERFIDTPVKHYSSGMYLRLAFAVAAHLEPEILLVDEVLAVGDAAFQRKCLGKMDDVAKQGRTVLFVSHNLPAVEKLCQRAAVIDGGRIVKQGDPVDCISFYLNAKSVQRDVVDLSAVKRFDPRLRPILTSFQIQDQHGGATTTVGSGEPVTFQVDYDAGQEIVNPTFGIIISTALGTPLFFLQTRAHVGLIDRAPATGTLRCSLERLPLVPGEYLVTVGCTSNDRQVDLLEQVARFTVDPRDFFGTGYLPHHLNGQVLMDASWDLSGIGLPSRSGEVSPWK